MNDGLRIRALLVTLTAGAVLVGALVVAALWVVGSEAEAQPANVMAIDAPPGPHALGVPFAVTAKITTAGTAYSVYQAYIKFDTTQLVHDNSTSLDQHLASGAGYTSTTAFIDRTTPDGVSSFAGRAEGAMAYVGNIVSFGVSCVADGTWTIALVNLTDDPSIGSTTIGPGGNIETSLGEVQVTCGAGGPGPSTPVPTSTSVTPPSVTSPSPTPPLGGPTVAPTPLPEGMEAVGLATGCNSVTSTYGDATPIQTIATAVGPAGALEALWAFELGIWLGYSPEFAQASDLTAADFLEVLFICARSPGSFARPIV